MSFRNVIATVFVAVIPLLLVNESFSQGIIIPRPCVPVRRCPVPIPPTVALPVSLPVKSVAIDTKIERQVAKTKVVQVFRNDTRFTLEGVYFFPIPENASVERFAIWENGKMLPGEVRSKEEARKIYDQIVRSKRDPGLLEYAGKDLLQVSIFPIPPNSDKKLELTYSQVLKADSGTVSYAYPLGSGKAVWNRASLAGRPGSGQSFGTVSGKVEIVAKDPIVSIYSPSHGLDVNRKGANRVVATFESSGDASDFRLFYGLSRSEFGLSLITHREPGKDGYYLLMISPSDELDNDKVVPKDVIFVIDTSGSMQAEGKMEKARPALDFGIRSLNKGDRFNIINFAGEEHLMETGLIPATDGNKDRGSQFVKRLKPDGGTNIDDALQAALGQFGDDERPKMLVLLTDGLPTVGVRDVDEIIEHVRAKNVKGLRLFPFGVGYDVNTRLLDKLGSENGGISEYVQPKEDLEIKVSGFFRKVNSPVLSNLKLDYGLVKVEKNHPRKLPDIFRGSQVVITGRYTNDDDLAAVRLGLEGLFGRSRKTFNFNGLDFPIRSADNDFLPRLWASRRVGWLIEQIRSNGESKEIKDEIIELGTRYGLVTPYTSYLAADGTFQARATSGNNFAIDGTSSAAISRTLKAESGADAVRLSVQQNSLQSNMMVGSGDKSVSNGIFLPEGSENQFVANKNFIRDGNVWIDTSFEEAKGLPVRKLKFGSDAFFEFALNTPAAAEYLSLGKNVTFVLHGQVYRITE